MFDRCLGARTGQSVGPGGAVVDPVFKRGDLAGRQPLALWRHHLIRIGGNDALEQGAVRAFAGDNSRFAGFAAVENDRTIVEAKIGFLLFVAVAVVTTPGEDRLDIAGKINWRSRSNGRQPEANNRHDRHQNWTRRQH